MLKEEDRKDPCVTCCFVRSKSCRCPYGKLKKKGRIALYESAIKETKPNKSLAFIIAQINAQTNPVGQTISKRGRAR